MKLDDGRDEYQPPKSGLLLLQFCIVLLFALFCARFWYLQIHRGADYVRMAQENRLRHERIYAPRGEIYDAAGRLIAENRTAYGLALVREYCPDISAALAQVSAWTGVPLERIRSRYEQDRSKGRSFDPILVLTDMPFEQVAPIEAELYKWPGLRVVSHSRRFYPEGEAFSHILGYVAEASEKELADDSGLTLGDMVGRQGLESVYEKRLRGQKGLYRLEVDVLGRPLSRTLMESPHMGQNITLSIDTRLQKAVMEAMGDYSGSVVVMDPDSGRLLALVTRPAYDNNIFIGGLSARDWKALRDNPRFPLQNRAIQSAYPPGSVWKLMMAGMLLEHGISPQEKVFCPGWYKLGNHTFRCWRAGGHGMVDMQNSLVWSCDVYYYSMAVKLGINTMEPFARACGYGRETGIDLPYETSGLVPSRAWKKRRFSEAWQMGDTVNASIGQGHVLVTPLQTAVVLSALVNGGDLLKPQLLADAPREVTGRIPVGEASREWIKKAMVRTVEGAGATAKVLKRDDMRIGGKTGTAQVVKLRMKGDRRLKSAEMEFRQRDHAWIGSWGEKDGRRVVVVTMVEHGGGGGAVAGPVTKAVYEILFPLEAEETAER
ncbi:penicillin-binding protein 2 [Mailhella sp.]|uniref:penicillin-binding protein 2 n=1 Tax=Mailhella sp. TaxID=1981029 RepID=UPI00406307DA